MATSPHDCCPHCGHEMTWREIATLLHPQGHYRYVAVESNDRRVAVKLEDWRPGMDVVQG